MNDRPTMYKKHKWFSGLRHFGAINQLRQICDLTGLFNLLNLCQKANLAKCDLRGNNFEITYDFLYESLGVIERTNWIFK